MKGISVGGCCKRGHSSGRRGFKETDITAGLVMGDKKKEEEFNYA